LALFGIVSPIDFTRKAILSLDETALPVRASKSGTLGAYMKVLMRVIAFLENSLENSFSGSVSSALANFHPFSASWR
jgi:hypothetical protein